MIIAVTTIITTIFHTNDNFIATRLTGVINTVDGQNLALPIIRNIP